MKRDALRVFLRRLVMASLPVTSAGCGHDAGGAGGDGGAPDVAKPVVIDGSAPDVTMGPDDLTSSDLVDMCLTRPPMQRVVPWDGDGGMPDCLKVCEPAPQGYFNFGACTLETADMGRVVVCRYTACGIGRRPAGLVAPAIEAPSEVAACLARAAHLEAASVHAFVRLAAELRAHGAPRDLIERARRAASDEVRHARVTGALARRWGAIVPKVVVAVEAPRALEAIAVENAVEGCVGETWGALIATWQGERAGDEGIRDAMRAIADDELGHATLAWDVAAWIEPLLDEAERSRVVAARRDAARELARLVDEEQPPSLVTDLGLPSRERAGALLAGALVLWT